MKIKRIVGIQKKYLIYTLALLLLALGLSTVGVWTYMRMNMTGVILDKYEFVTEKMGIALDTLYQKSKEVTGNCITEDSVQNSLKTRDLEQVEKIALSKYFAYIDLECVEEYCYVDNKGNVYTKSYSNISCEDFQNSGFSAFFDRSYAKTEWIYRTDHLFHTEDRALFIVRNVHSMDYAHAPGMIILRMDKQFLRNIIEDKEELQDAAIGIVDSAGNFCMQSYPAGFSMDLDNQKAIRELAASTESGMICRGLSIKGGMLQAYRQKDTGMVVFTFVPNYILTKGFDEIFRRLLGIFAVVGIFAIILSLYVSNIFTRPIHTISEAMTNFDGTDFHQKVEINTNTELDKIGHSYNEMLDKIEELLDETKNQQKELRTSELNMLINQINPHFLYNTLDTIYMLARINGEEKTMKMIQALSNYLRLSLSKGSDIVTVEDELENVRNYMEIQQIRRPGMFTYEVNSTVETKERWILKLILQPIVENAMKYGFCELEEGGLIRIDVTEEEGHLTLTVFNNGIPMEKEMQEKINALEGVPIVELKNAFPDKKRGYGVVNILTRLRLKYGDNVKFRYEIQEDGTTCIIQLPENGKENHEQ